MRESYRLRAAEARGGCAKGARGGRGRVRGGGPRRSAAHNCAPTHRSCCRGPRASERSARDPEVPSLRGRASGASARARGVARKEARGCHVDGAHKPSVPMRRPAASRRPAPRSAIAMLDAYLAGGEQEVAPMRPAAAPTAPTDGAARPAEAANTPADDVSMLCASTMPSAQQATRAANLDHAAPPELSTGSQPAGPRLDDPAELDVYIDRYEQLLEDVRGMLDLDDGRPSSPPAQPPAPPPAEVSSSHEDAPEASTARPGAAAPSPAKLLPILDGPGRLSQWEFEPLRERNRALRERLRALQ